MLKSKKDNRETQRNAVDTIVGEQCTIKGNLFSPQSIKIDGKVEGNINAEGCIIIGEKARVIGNLQSQEMIIYGYLEGDIQSSDIQLKNTARIYGNIQTELFQVEHGAVYQGGVNMSDNAAFPQQKITLPEKAGDGTDIEQNL